MFQSNGEGFHWFVFFTSSPGTAFFYSVRSVGDEFTLKVAIMFFRVVKTCNFFGKRRFEFNIRYNNAIKQFRQQDIEIWTAKGLALDDHSELPTSTDQEMIEIVVSQFPEAARELVVLELEAMTRSE